MNNNICNDQIVEFTNFLKKHNMQIFILDVSKVQLDNLPLIDYFSIEMYYRILAQFILPENIERILWLDADIIVMDDISEFYNQSFEDNHYVVCPDSMHYKPWVLERKDELRLPAEYIYFNSGVMLMNLDKLRRTTSQEKITDISISLKDKLLYPDQDILNYIYHDNVKYCDWKRYNYQLVCMNKIPKEDIKNIAILHYTGPNKPWDPWKFTSAAKYYWKVRIKQGDIIPAIKAYFTRIQDITKRYFNELKGIF